MQDNNCEICGVWSGRFWHGSERTDNVLFSAWLHLSNGQLQGSTLEPNTLFEDKGEELDASLRGHLNQSEIVFLKTYHGVDLEPVYCEGEIVDHGKRIVGQWYFGWPEEHSGAFEMSREGASQVAEKASRTPAETQF